MRSTMVNPIDRYAKAAYEAAARWQEDCYGYPTMLAWEDDWKNAEASRGYWRTLASAVLIEMGEKDE